MELRLIWHYLRPYRLHMLGAFLSLAMVTVAYLSIPGLVGASVNEIIRTGSFRVLDRAALIILGVIVTRGVFLYVQSYLTSFLGHRTIADLRQDLFARMQHWSMDRFAIWQTGDAISRTLQDTQVVDRLLVTGLVNLLATTLTLAGIIVALFVLQWRLALLAALVIPIAVLVARLYGREVQRMARRAQGHVAGLASVVREAFAGALVIRAFAQEEQVIERFAEENQRATAISVRIGRLLASQEPIVSFLAALAAVAVLWGGGRMVASGALSPGGLVSFLAYMAIAVDPAGIMARRYGELRQALGALQRIRHMLEVGTDVPEAADALTLQRVTGRITYEQVSFRYPDAPESDWVLRDVSLEIAPGERVALVGLSGAGKTTLVHLLPRFYDPTAGSVAIDGIDIRRVRLRSLRRQIGFVPQETMLFRGTVRENIAFAKPNASPAEVEAAARLANAHGFISALPQGYDTLLAEDGTTLSGGQRQRLAIARALLHDPRILILDEATSSLDSESEALFQEALERAVQGRTTITIAHRLSTVRQAQRIAVLHEGRVIDEGRHEDLLHRNPLYARLARLQWPEVTDLSAGVQAGT